MNIMRDLQRSLALRRVARHEDHVVQEYVAFLMEDNARLRKLHRTMRHDRFTPSGRYVLRRMVGVGILGLLLTFITIAAIEIVPQVQAMRAARVAENAGPTSGATAVNVGRP